MMRMLFILRSNKKRELRYEMEEIRRELKGEGREREYTLLMGVFKSLVAILVVLPLLTGRPWCREPEDLLVSEVNLGRGAGESEFCSRRRRGQQGDQKVPRRMRRTVRVPLADDFDLHAVRAKLVKSRSSSADDSGHC